MVVTIVVLLILAGVSISLILDNNGIIQKSKDARKQYGEAQENEQADLEDVSSWIEKAASEFEIVEPENIDDWIYREEDDGTITIISYKGLDTTVIVPNYINNKRVKSIKTGIENHSIESLWSPEICSSERLNYFLVQDTIKEVIISNGIERIDNETMFGAFTNSKALEKVVIPDSIKYIGHTTFYNCTNLTNINIPNGVTNIGDGAFSSCTNLNNITIPDSVTNIGDGAFSSCTNLNNITIPDSVTNIGERAFYNCTSLTNITIPNNVTNIGNNAFSRCTNLNNITIPNSVTNIGERAFYNCTGLTNITIPNSVTDIGDGVFIYCTSLTNITIPNSVTTMGSAVFSAIPSITVNVPFKEGETPEGWATKWNYTSTGNNITINYLK